MRDEQRPRRMWANARWGGAVWLALGLGACGGATVPSDAGVTDAALPDDDGGAPDAALADLGALDATLPDLADMDVADAAPSCSADGALAIAGDYVAGDGTRHWLRKSATAATYAVVPGGAPDPAAPPRLYRIVEVCPGWLLLAEVGGGTARLDWAQGGDGLHLCVRPAASADEAAALAAPDADDTTTGCAGSAWTVLAGGAP